MLRKVRALSQILGAKLKNCRLERMYYLYKPGDGALIDDAVLVIKEPKISKGKVLASKTPFRLRKIMKQLKGRVKLESFLAVVDKDGAVGLTGEVEARQLFILNGGKEDNVDDKTLEFAEFH
jgi:hypothetical protein